MALVFHQEVFLKLFTVNERFCSLEDIAIQTNVFGPVYQFTADLLRPLIALDTGVGRYSAPIDCRHALPFVRHELYGQIRVEIRIKTLIAHIEYGMFGGAFTNTEVGYFFIRQAQFIPPEESGHNFKGSCFLKARHPLA